MSAEPSVATPPDPPHMPRTDVRALGGAKGTRPTLAWTTGPGQWRSTAKQLSAVVAGASLLLWMVMCGVESLATAQALGVSTHTYGLHFDVPLWAALLAALIAADYVPSAKILVHEGAHAVAGLCARADEVHINLAPSLAPYVVFSGVPSRARAVLICLAGPVAELTLGAALLSASPHGWPALAHPLGVSGWLCVVGATANLLPFGGLDGGKAWKFATSTPWRQQ